MKKAIQASSRACSRRDSDSTGAHSHTLPSQSAQHAVPWRAQEDSGSTWIKRHGLRHGHDWVDSFRVQVMFVNDLRDKNQHDEDYG